MSLNNLFSTYVHYKNNLNVDNESLKEFAYKVEKSGSFYRKMSNVGGFQTMDIQNLQHDIPPFKKLISEIVSEANIASKYYKINNRIGLNQIWININRFINSDVFTKLEIIAHCYNNDSNSIYYCKKTWKKNG